MKKMLLIATAVTWVASAAVIGAQQKATPLKPATPPASPPASTTSPVPENAKTEKTAIERMEKFAGTIERVDEVGKILVVRGRKDTLTLTVDDKTKIVRGGKDMPFSDLKNQMGVAVDYRAEGDKRIAVSIRVAAPKAVPKEKAAEVPKK